MTSAPFTQGIATTVLDRGDSSAPALSVDGSTLGWDALAGRIEAAASALSATHVGSRIALAMPNGIDLAVTFLAGARIGLNVHIFDPAWPPAMRDGVLRSLGGMPVLTAMSAGGASPGLSMSEDTGRPFYTGFTSGSTGVPKGFTRDQRSWLESFRGDTELFGFDAGDTFIVPGNLAHSLFMYAMSRGLYAGCHTVLWPSFRPGDIVTACEDIESAALYATPTQLDAMATAASRRGIVLPGVRVLLSSGSALPDHLRPLLRRVFPAAGIYEFYGTSELSYIACARDGEAPVGSVGKAFPGVEVCILGPGGRKLPTGETGHVHVRSPLAFSGYADPETPALPEAAGALTVGDVGYMDADGYLYLVGRADRMIVSAGRNIYPEEVEAVLAAHPDVLRAAVFGIADRRRGQRLVAAIKPVQSTPLPETSTLIAWCRRHLPDYKAPRTFVALADWPETASMKTDFVRLGTMIADGAT